MTLKTRVADYRLEMAFDQNATGIFYIETSALDGTDGLSDSTTSYAFSGSFDDVTDDVVDDVTVVAGTDALAGALQASNLTAELLDPSDLARWNPNNPSSLLNTQSPGFVPMRPVRLRALVDGVAGTFTLSGNEITDDLRTAQGPVDGFLAGAGAGVGIYDSHTNVAPNTTFASGTTGWTPVGGGTISSLSTANPFPGHSAMNISSVISGDGVAMSTSFCPAAASGQSWCDSVWLFATGSGVTATVSVQGLSSAFLNTETFSVSVLLPATATWTRVNVAALLANASTAYVRIRVTFSFATTVRDVRMVAPMLANSYFDAPYIANSSTTAGSSTTRGNSRVQAPTSLLDETQMWAAFRVARSFAASATRSSINALFRFWDDTNNQLRLVLSTGNSWQSIRESGGVTSTAAKADSGYAENDVDTLIYAVDSGSVKVSVNGAAFTTVASVNIPTLAATLFDIGSTGVGARLNGRVTAAAFGTGPTTDLDAAVLDALFTPGAPTPADIPDRLRATATWDATSSSYLAPGATSYGVFWGFVRRAEWDSDTCSCQIYCEDLLLWMSRSFPVIASTGATTTGAAIGAILSAIGWGDPAYRRLDTGDALTDFSSDGTISALDLIQALLEAERGTVYQDGDGTLVYEQRSTSRLRTSSWTLDDELLSQTSGIDADALYTRASVTGVSGIEQTASNTDVEAIYGRSDAPAINSTYITSDTNAAALAADIVYEGQAGKPPITIAVDNDSDATEIQILTSPLLSVFTISETLGNTEGDFVVQRKSHTVRSQYHKVEYLLQKRQSREFDVTTSAIDGPDVFRY